MEPDTTTATGADTLLGILDEAAQHGYDTQQIARRSGHIECTACNRESPPADFEVDHVRRLEGASDAADELLVVWSACPKCAERGALTLAYGPTAGETDTIVIEQLDLSRADPSPTTTVEPNDPTRSRKELVGVDETPESREAAVGSPDMPTGTPST